MLFIHNGFRTSSTWFGFKFRHAKRFYFFYEPYNESLIDLSGSSLSGPNDWNSRHSGSDPYFLEYLPLISPEGGVRKYKSEFSFANFVPADGIGGKLTLSELDYISSLLDLAARFGRIPIIACTRSLGRVRSLRAAFGGVHIMLHRPLVDQWLSFVSYKDTGNAYFVTTIWHILHLNYTKLPFFRHVFQRYLDNKVQSVDDFLCIEEHIHFKLFLAIHLYLCATASQHCDIVVDVGKLYADQRYRSSISNIILAKIGVVLDFDDVVREVQIKDLDYPNSEVTEVENDVINFLFKEGYSATVPFVLDQTREVRADLALLKCSARFWRSKIADPRPND